MAVWMCAGMSQGADALVIGYFPQWGVYDRHYLVKDVERSGAADHLDVLCYAFTAIGPEGHVALTDANADIGQPFPPRPASTASPMPKAQASCAAASISYASSRSAIRGSGS
jgi:GH18 family chitinase